MNTQKKGFTLIELLIVIGIIGILAAAVIVVLNPAELLAQARDGTRLSDVDSVNSAINLYIASTSSIDLTAASGSLAYRGAQAACSFVGPCAIPTTGIQSTDGTGWVAVDLDEIAGGSPLPVLPLDPTNDTDYFYAYAGDEANSVFEVHARLESQRHRGKMLTDGGDENVCGATWVDITCFYEKGTDPGLDL